MRTSLAARRHRLTSVMFRLRMPRRRDLLKTARRYLLLAVVKTSLLGLLVLLCLLVAYWSHYSDVGMVTAFVILILGLHQIWRL